MTWKTVLLSLVVLWFIPAQQSSLRTSEYANIVSDLDEVTVLGECEISTKITREWPYSWAISSAEITVKNKNTLLTATTSKFKLPDRKRLNTRNTQHHFTWTETKNNALFASYMDVEIDSTGKVSGLKIGNCSNYSNDTDLIGYLEHCNSVVESATCL
ncbi:hypothetical protein I6F65_00320 [Pseudoalteromonas sp. SWXJZ94C]|uniref:hypothetical protein n=1 Tax=Pseudoalteromonas sp. SWXJZ94C TaxID=2792065 RepID=UPI0018CE2414|nr:hypothetical protein [Pseudoalteromonas sp. SWXJZ94C]MBH0055399.1 hypothetical protein [Pseudoalteromonas sp. SWXJZ94C]